MVFGMSCGEAHHIGEAVLDFLFPATGQQGDDRKVRGERREVRGKRGDDFGKGMSYVDGLRQVVFGVELLLEGEDVAETVEIFPHAFQAAFFPSPQLWGDIMDGLDAVIVGPLLDF